MLKKKRRIGIAIDMTPMVDVAFLLLIFFMCTTQFKPPEKDKITLPESNSEAKSPESDIITIAVTSPRPEYGNQSIVRVIYRKGGQEVSQPVPPSLVKVIGRSRIPSSTAASGRWTASTSRSGTGTITRSRTSSCRGVRTRTSAPSSSTSRVCPIRRR